MTKKQEHIMNAVICGSVWGLLVYAAAMIVRGAVLLG